MEDPLEDRAVELFLRIEVPVHDELRDLAGRGDVFHRGGREARVGERARRAAEDGGLPFRPSEELPRALMEPRSCDKWPLAQVYTDEYTLWRQRI